MFHGQDQDPRRQRNSSYCNASISYGVFLPNSSKWERRFLFSGGNYSNVTRLSGCTNPFLSKSASRGSPASFGWLAILLNDSPYSCQITFFETPPLNHHYPRFQRLRFDVCAYLKESLPRLQPKSLLNSIVCDFATGQITFFADLGINRVYRNSNQPSSTPLSTQTNMQTGETEGTTNKPG